MASLLCLVSVTVRQYEKSPCQCGMLPKSIIGKEEKKNRQQINHCPNLITAIELTNCSCCCRWQPSLIPKLSGNLSLGKLNSAIDSGLPNAHSSSILKAQNSFLMRQRVGKETRPTLITKMKKWAQFYGWKRTQVDKEAIYFYDKDSLKVVTTAANSINWVIRKAVSAQSSAIELIRHKMKDKIASIDLKETLTSHLALICPSYVSILHD